MKENFHPQAVPAAHKRDSGTPHLTTKNSFTTKILLLTPCLFPIYVKTRAKNIAVTDPHKK